VIHAIAHSAESETHLLRQDLISDNKNDTEGSPKETKVCLGWILDTRHLLVSLPFHKLKAWDSQLVQVLSQNSVSDKDLCSVLGCLENVAMIVCMFGHFLNNIRSMQMKVERTGHNAKLTAHARGDISLAHKFLKLAHSGVSMNLITF
jgi:hypothetical protein